MWHGPRLAELRAAVASADYSIGCELCEPPAGLRIHPTAPARSFDHLAPRATEAWPRQLELALSNTCNLRCTMCFGELSSSIRAHREGLPPLPEVYGAEFFADLEEFLPHLESLKFIGGEPFLSREAWRVWELLDKIGHHPPCHVTTNATIRNRRVEQVLDKFPMAFTVSLDGASAESFERIRIGARFEEVVTNLDYFTATARSRGTSVSLAFCLSTESWRELPRVLEFGEDRALPVGVNLVTEPSRLSLWRAPAPLLAAVAETWTDQHDAVSRRLELNRTVWDDNVAWAVAATEQARRDETESTVAISDPSGFRTARRLAESHALGGPVLVVEIDAEDRILALEGTHAFSEIVTELKRFDLLGRPLVTLVSGPIIEQFGAVFTSHSEDRANRSVRLLSMTFAGDPATSVQVVTAAPSSEPTGRAFVTVAR